MKKHDGPPEGAEVSVPLVLTEAMQKKLLDMAVNNAVSQLTKKIVNEVKRETVDELTEKVRTVLTTTDFKNSLRDAVIEEVSKKVHQTVQGELNYWFDRGW